MGTKTRVSFRGLFGVGFIFGGLVGFLMAISMGLRNPVSSPGSEDQKDRIVATVGSHDINLREVEQRASISLYEADQQRDAILRSTLQRMIDEELLESEAAQKGMTVEQLLSHAYESPDIARLANVPAPVRRLATPQASNDSQLLQDSREQTRIRQALLVSLRRRANVHITLPQPEPPVLAVSADDDPAIGADRARITIVEFSDFECPYCKMSVPVIKEILKEYPLDVKVVYRDYPGRNHRYANQAAQAAQCAGDQGKFWAYHDLLFEQQNPHGWDFAALATELKLDSAAFASCLSTGRHREEVMADLRDGLKLGISSTPTFFVNGRPMIGARPVADFKALVDQLLVDKTPSSRSSAKLR
jgi:protein-disulfide isomerase